MKALIVDDDDNHRRLLRTLLEARGYQVYEALDGSVAWQILQAEPIPLVLTDWMMPEMDGVDLIHAIRAANFPYYTYIMLLTAKQQRGDMIDGLESGTDDYVVKPFDLAELKARLSIAERILSLEARLREALGQASYYATRDSLTGALNRRALYEWASVLAEQSLLTVIMVDIDHFKRVNDLYGHLVGDEALRLIAETINANKRATDQMGRWGGEEFLLVLPGASLESGRQLAERLRSAIKKLVLPLPDGSTFSVSASFGVACGPIVSGEVLDRLILQADTAMYQAKQAGRNRVCVYQGD